MTEHACHNIEPPSNKEQFTFVNWVWGNIGIFLAMWYVLGWYFLFALPLIIVFFGISLVVKLVVEDQVIAMNIAMWILSPLSITFLIWQILHFAGPAYFDICKAMGFFGQRVHQYPPRKALALVRARRVVATEQFYRFLRWLRIPI